jgi:SAM-dependent methyltransferase
MHPEEVRRLYDTDYAATYDARFLGGAIVAPDAQFEVELLRTLLQGGPDWLDVACGTGHFLRQFPHVRRTGIDLSPAMLERARQGNEGVEFLEQDFRQPRQEWSGRFGLISCMWYAYTLVDTMADISVLVRNMADWTSASGTCFLPLADPRLIARVDLPREHFFGSGADGGRVTIDGILWSYIEEDGRKVHAHLVTPQVEYMVAEFGRHFTDVRVVRYPHKPDGIHGRPALIATGKT